ncbi:MAG: hypothetical protein ACREJO_12165 [Phycisphaerales bacterium]
MNEQKAEKVVAVAGRGWQVNLKDGGCVFVARLPRTTVFDIITAANYTGDFASATRLRELKVRTAVRSVEGITRPKLDEFGAPLNGEMFTFSLRMTREPRLAGREIASRELLEVLDAEDLDAIEDTADGRLNAGQTGN